MWGSGEHATGQRTEETRNVQRKENPDTRTVEDATVCVGPESRIRYNRWILPSGFQLKLEEAGMGSPVP